MRTIKFRGKSLTTGEWLYGSHFNDGAEDYILPNLPSGVINYEDYQVDLNTIGQFTCLHDANGKEIYEWDIVKVPFSECDRVGRLWVNDLPTSLNGVVALDETRACFIVEFPYHNKHNICACDFGLTQGKFEVIGNKYDNLELLYK